LRILDGFFYGLNPLLGCAKLISQVAMTASAPKVSMTFVNLPVSDLKASMAFYGSLGFAFNPQFTDETAACMILSESSFAMLLTHSKFQSFTETPIPDSKSTTGVLIALSLPNRESVDQLLTAALMAGGAEPVAAKDYGFMYQRTMADRDGHRWEPFFFDAAKMPLGAG
jgi:uncharacterized protein